MIHLAGWPFTNFEKLIKVAVKDVRTGGVNLNKLWSTLSSLRDDVAKTGSESPSTTGNGEKILGFPDPLPPPASATTARSLRSDRVSNDMINVVQSSQMIPVIVSLVHSALATRIIREEIEQGSKDSKDVFRDAKEAIRIENERWEKERTTIEVGVKDKARKAEVGTSDRPRLSSLMRASEPCQAVSPQGPNYGHRECIEACDINLCTSVHAAWH